MDLRKYLFSTTGRFLRKDFWFTTIGVHAALVLFLFLLLALAQGKGEAVTVELFGFWLPLFSIIACWISAAAQIKRWHDLDKPWPWIFISIIPIVGQLWVFVECGCCRGSAGENRFGLNPSSREKV